MLKLLTNPIIVVIIILLISATPLGLATERLGKKKGYKSCFLNGFFFGIFGLIYTAGLPITKEMRQRDYRPLENDIEDIIEYITNHKK